MTVYSADDGCMHLEALELLRARPSRPRSGIFAFAIFSRELVEISVAVVALAELLLDRLELLAQDVLALVAAHLLLDLAS